MEKVFPLGVHIYRVPHLPIEELKKDMAYLKKIGFNMVKIQEIWAHDEPEKGKIDLGDIEELLQEAEKLDLLVYFGFTMEQVPTWLWKEYPDCRMVYFLNLPHDEPGQYVLPGDGKPGPCWYHPDAKREGERFIKEVVRRLSKYNCIAVWNVWQEIGLWPMLYSHPAGVCYCKYTLSEFRRWLKRKYRTLERLSKAWRRRIIDWEQVEPPRIYPSVPSFIDWHHFMEEVYLPYALKWKVKAVREADPLKRPVFAHVSSPSYGSRKDWEYAKTVDFFGCSCYPTWGPFGEWDKFPRLKPLKPRDAYLKQELWKMIFYRFDYLRSACQGKDFWAAEFQGGRVVTYWKLGREITYEDIERWIIGALACGIKGLCFWNHKAEIMWQEAYGFGLMDLQERKREKIERVGKISQKLNRKAEFFLNSKVPPAEVGIVIPDELWHFCKGSARHQENWVSEGLKHYLHSLAGIYRALWERGVWVDFIDGSNFSGEGVKNYKALLLVFPLCLRESLCVELKKYVEQGGVLISEACPGRYDEYGFAREKEMEENLCAVFGVEQESLSLCLFSHGRTPWPVSELSGEMRKVSRLKGMGDFQGKSVIPSFYIQTFLPKTAKPMLISEIGIVGVENYFAKGKAYLIGTFLGHAICSFEDRATGDFLFELLKQAGVRGNKVGKALLRKKIIDQERELWFLINPSSGLMKVNLEKEGGNFECLLDDGKEIKKLKLKPFEIKCLLFRKDGNKRE